MAKGFSVIIQGRIPSKKNSMAQFFNKKTGRMISYYTSNTKNWMKEKKEELLLLHLDKCFDHVSLTLNFYMPDARRTDLINKAESILDVLVASKIIQDDDYLCIDNLHMYYKGIDRAHPRVEIILVEII